MALVLKTSEVKASVGSNPTLSAFFHKQRSSGLAGLWQPEHLCAA